ncbi:prolyl oligopeptidase [Gongronella butleri]|nr:prolyl oligopeptidase [Gongronella butleri]
MNMTIRKVLMSPDHSIFAYNTEREGMEYGDLHFKDLQNRPQWQVYAHRIGTDQAQDVLVYEEPDETAFVDITSTKDGKFVTINSNSLSSSEIRVVDASFIPHGGTTTPSMVLMQPRQPGLEYYVDHHQDTFYILTNAQGATNFKLMKAHDGALRMDQWRDVLSMQPTDKIEDVDLFQDHIVVYGRRDGLPMVLCYDIAREESHVIALPTSCCVVSPSSNLDFHTNTFRFSLTSPFSHDATYEYDMNERKLKCIRRHDIQGIDKKNPVLMRSYGAYGVNTDPDFRIEHFPLLERGWVIALAHVSFRDFVSVAAHMAQGSGISSSGRLAAMGTSAGGLLVGGMAHLAPAGLFKALVLRVPFVDPLSAMLNPSLPLTSVEVPEWGDPLQDARAYDWMAAYAPYDNAKFSKNRPAMYVTAGMKDQRVLYWQPLKFVARLRDIEAQNTENARPPPLLLNVDLDRGHFGGQGEQDTRLNEAAEQVTFLISQLQQSI